MAADPLLDHLEKTFADAYRKEIDQEENVWRSLPFFAAALALQLAALGQAREWLAGLEGPALLTAFVLLAVAFAAMLAAIAFLFLSIWPADFQYVAREPAIRDYAEQVHSKAKEAGETVEAAEAALRTVKVALAEQYATATDNNRSINQRRARWRTRAGVMTLFSVLFMLALVAFGVVHNTYGQARSTGTGSSVEPRESKASGGNLGFAPAEQHTAAPYGGGSQGLVEQQGDGAPCGRLGEGKR
jgi:hypothetical protein